MLDNILSEIVNEVAFEGDQGCTFAQLFEHVETLAKKSLSSTKLIKPLQFDDNYKAYIWSRLQCNDQLIFTENDTPFDPSSFSYQELKSKSSDIIVKSTEEAQDLCIFGSSKSEKNNLSDKHKQVLDLVAKSRSQGISQYQLGETLKMDPRSVFYYLKKLDQLGIIVKEEAYVSGMNTRIIMLKQFADLKQTKSNKTETKDKNESDIVYRLSEFKETVLKKLRAAKDYTILLLELVNSLGLETKTQIRWARVRLADLHDQGVVEKFTAFDGKRKRQCVRLPLRECEQVELSARAPQAKDQDSHVKKQYALSRDLPSDYIFYQDVIAAGEKGILRQDFIDKYPFVDPDQFKVFFENASIPADDPELSKYLIYRTQELKGKTRQFRYYSLDGWRAICQKNGVVFADPELGNKQRKREGLVEPKSIDEIGNLFRGCLPPKRRKPDTKCEVNEPIKKQKALQLSDTVVDPVFGIAHHIPQTSIAPMTGNANPATLSQIHQPSTVARTKRNMDQMYGHAYNEDLSKLPNLPVHILKKSRKTKCHDNTRTRRQAIILDIIEKDRICEHSFELFKQCNEIEQAASGGPNMARRTFGTIIQQLHDEQKIRLYRTSIQTPFGLTEIKTLILHPSLTGESDQVKQFIASYNSHNTKIPVVTETPKRKALKKVEVDTPLPPLHRDSQKATTAKQVNSDNSNDAPGTWHFNATEYGYLNSKWLRAREFHMALFEYYKNNSENTTVDLSEFMKRMCLRRLMRFFGLLPYDNKILFDYLKTDANQDIPLNDLPDQIKPMIIKAMPRIRGSIMKNITVLKALELLEPDTEVDMARVGIPLTVTLRLTGLVKDYALKERPLLAALTLTDLDDARLFWVDLQAYCTQLHDRLTATNDDSDPLARIAGCRGWTSNTLLTPEQKTLLNSFVDFDAQTVPREEDRALRSHLMRKTGLPIGRIMAYFNSIMVAFKKYKTRSDRTRKRLEKKLSNPSSPAIRELLKASLEKRKVSAALFKMKETSPFVEPTFIGSRKIRHLRLQVEPYQDKPHGRLVRYVYDPFSTIEKDVLLHAYSIMKVRAEKLCFFWHPITQVIPNHTRDRCRRVLNQMLCTDPNMSKIVDLLKSKWITIYEQGITKKEIKDEQPWNTKKYDLSSYLQYFIIQLQREESELVRTQLTLPTTYKELQRNFHIIHKEAHIADSKASPMGDCLHVFKESAYDTVATIPKFDENAVSLDLVRTVIKMILMTPDENYSARAAYNVFKEFPDTVIEQALEDLKLEGLVISDKARYGRIPGRNINVSEKFLKFASGILPFELFKQAKEFYNDMADKKSFSLISSNLNGGDMAAALDLLSQGKVSIDFLDRKAYIKSKQVLYYPRASAVTVLSAFVFKNMNLILKEEKPLDIVDQAALVQNYQQQQIVSASSVEYLNSLETFDRSVYEIIRNFKKRGASWSDIIKKISLSNQDLSKSLQSLLRVKPALIITVGFKDLRYVASEFSSAWMLQTSSNIVGIPPLMWYDVSGQVIQPALEGYASTVMSYILLQPGITFAQLREKTKGFFTEFELHHLLKHLIDLGKVISKKVQRKARPKRISIFDKRPIISVRCDEGVNNDQVSHYWLSSNYYM